MPQPPASRQLLWFMFIQHTCMYYLLPPKHATMGAIMRRRSLSPLTSCLLFLLTCGQGYAQYSLTCASEDGHRHYCAADTRAGVSMLKQHSKSACTQGTTWGFDQNGVWVDRGCRADFLVNTPASVRTHNQDRDHDRDGDRDRDRDRDGDRDRDRDGDRDRDRDHDRDGNHFRDGDRYRDDQRRGDETMQLTCSSNDGGRHYCESDIQGKATMTRQRSGSPCREGYSWGYDRQGLWVDHGCRADFQLTGRRSGYAGAGTFPGYVGGTHPGYVGSLRCSSDLGTRQACPVDTRGGVKLVHQVSESSCRLGYSWGYDRDAIWVDHGCRAEFQIGSR